MCTAVMATFTCSSSECSSSSSSTAITTTLSTSRGLPPANACTSVGKVGLGNEGEDASVVLDPALGVEDGFITNTLTEPNKIEECVEMTTRKKRGGRRSKLNRGGESSEPERVPHSADTNMAVDEAMLCLKPRGIDKHSPSQKVAKELMRCLGEMKYMLILDTINVLGVERVLQLFNETMSIQENGGELTADGTRRKNPGGVFFTLVKKSSSAEQRREIFQKDKKIQVQRKREAQRRRLEEREEKIRKQKRELEETQALAQIRQERNIEKRLYGRTGQVVIMDKDCVCGSKDREHLSSDGLVPRTKTSMRIGNDRTPRVDCDDVVVAMEVDELQNPGCNTTSHRTQSPDHVLAQELALAEQFEQMSDTDVPVDFELV